MVYEKVDFSNLKSLIKKNNELKEILSKYSDTTLTSEIKSSLEVELQSCDLAVNQEVESFKLLLNLTQEPILPILTVDCSTKQEELINLMNTVVQTNRNSVRYGYDQIKTRLETIQGDFTLIIDGLEELGHVKAIREFMTLIQPMNIILFPEI